MHFALSLVVLAIAYSAVDSTFSAPKVQVYSEKRGELSQDNILVCRVSNFHPPDITIQLMKDGVELDHAKQTDLSFKQDWHFHLTRHVSFKPMTGEKYSCKVTHGQTAAEYAWESNM